MKKIAQLITLLSFMLWAAPMHIDAQVTPQVDPNTLVMKLKNKVKEEKKSMLETYPKFGTVNGINDGTVKRAYDKLSEGSTYDMMAASGLNLSYTEIKIYNWYIAQISKAPTVQKKQDLANDYTELSQLLDNLSIILGENASSAYYGGSMMSLIYSGQKNVVYEAWYAALKSTKPNKRIAPSEVDPFINSMRNEWDANYANLKEENSEYDLDGVEAMNQTIRKALTKVRTLTKKRPPYAWVVDMVTRAMEEMEM